jgi:hypothetical protein
VDLVPDGLVAVDSACQQGGFGLVDRKIGNGVDPSGVEALRLAEAACAAADWKSRGGMREVDAGRDGQDSSVRITQAAVAAVILANRLELSPRRQGERFVLADLFYLP